MFNLSDQAFPIHAVPSQDGYIQIGLTKRELFAAMAMQGWLSSWPAGSQNLQLESAASVARQSVLVADALLAELAKSPEA